MIIGYVKGQDFTLRQPTIASGTIDYLSATFVFSNSDWNECDEIWVHFAQGDKVYDAEIINGKVSKDEHINLSEGEWEVYLHGNVNINGEVVERITTEVRKLSVTKTGIIDGNPFPNVEASTAEKILAKAQYAVEIAEGVREDFDEMPTGGLTPEQESEIQANTEARHTHDNYWSLSDLHCEASEVEQGGNNPFPIVPDVVGVDRPTFRGNFLRYDSDGAVINKIEEKSENGSKFFRMWFDKGILDTLFDVPLFIDIPVTAIEEKTEIGLNGTGLELDLGVGSGGGGGSVEIDTTLTQKGAAADAKATGDRFSKHYTKQEIDDKGFITKADIPTDEGYELIGQTPLTLDETSNIKLVAEGETTYSIETPTVWNFDGTYDSSVLCTLEKVDGYYKVTADATATKWYQSYMVLFVRNLKIGETYTLTWDVSSSNKIKGNSTTPSDWGGSFSLYSGETVNSLIKTGLNLDDNASYSFTATDTILQMRYYPTYSNSLPANSIGKFNTLYLNKGTTTELTVPYKNSGTFTETAIFKAIPEGATITATSTADVYIKAPTDKTLTKNDVPADAKVTGERIEAVKNLLPLYGKTIVNFGDSIFGNQQPPNDISTFLAEKTGATVYNCGFGGCRMSVHPTSEYNAFSMYSLANSIASGDYTTQETALESTAVTLPERFTPSVERLKGIDFSKVDIVTIAYGTNDYTGVPLENEDNLLDTSTFGGALRYSIEKLLTAYPNLRIFVLSTAYRFWIDENNEFTEDSNTKVNSIGLKLGDYNAKLKEIAEEYNLPYVDDYNIGIGKFNRYQYFNANDGAHHKEEGRRLIAEHLAIALSMGNNIPDSSIDKVTLSTSSATLNANRLYDFGVTTELTINFAKADPTKYNEYMFTFTSGATPTVLTLPDTVKWVNELTIEANKRYEISIVDNIGLWCAVEVNV